MKRVSESEIPPHHYVIYEWEGERFVYAQPRGERLMVSTKPKRRWLAKITGWVGRLAA